MINVEREWSHCHICHTLSHLSGFPIPYLAISIPILSTLFHCFILHLHVMYETNLFFKVSDTIKKDKELPAKNET